MNKLQFDVLRLISEHESVDIAGIARELYKGADEVSNAISSLQKNGMLKGYSLTKNGRDVLNAHRIKNAIILAAGMSTRFIPLNFEKPKGLLVVKGETLIERQIRHLREKGIEEIIVVVGYMKECFEFLKEKYGVILVEAKDYAERNNHASVYAAKEYLKNTIITSSDLYFSENIFQTYAYDSYYCTLFVPGKTAERGIETDSDDKIIDTFYGDKCYDTWITLGYAFFSENFSKKMISFIEAEFDLPETANQIQLQ